MADVTYYVAVPFELTDEGLIAGEGADCPTAGAALMRAEALSRTSGYAGAIALSRTVDASLGKVLYVSVIRRYGQVPGDLSTLKYFKGFRSQS